MATSPLTLVWDGDRERLRTPFRLGLATTLFLALGEAIRQVAIRAAMVGDPLGARLEAVWVIFVAAVGLGLALFGILGIAWGLDRRPPASLGLAVDRAWATEALWGAVLGGAMVTATVGGALLVGVATVDGLLASWVGTFALTADHALLDATFWVVVFLGAGILEEVLFRGYLLVNVAEGLAGYTATPRQALLGGVGVAGVVFGLVHATNPGDSLPSVVNVILFGLVFGGSVVATGRLALAVGLHVSWNVTLGLGYGLPVSGIETGAALVDVDLQGARLLTGGTFGPEGGLLALVGLVVGSATLAWSLGRRGRLAVDPTLLFPDKGQ